MSAQESGKGMVSPREVSSPWTVDSGPDMSQPGSFMTQQNVKLDSLKVSNAISTEE